MSRASNGVAAIPANAINTENKLILGIMQFARPAAL